METKRCNGLIGFQSNSVIGKLLFSTNKKAAPIGTALNTCILYLTSYPRYDFNILLLEV